MGLFAQLFAMTRTGPSFAPSNPTIASVFSGGETASGVRVDEWTALNYSAVWASVRVISEGIAIMPQMLKRQTEKGSQRAPDHNVDRIVGTAPNPNATPITYMETAVAHALTWGNHYAEIERNNLGEPIARHILTPNRVRPELDKSDNLRYRIKNFDRPDSFLKPEDCYHVPGLGFDGLQGYSVITVARESIGLGKTAEKHGASFFGNGARPSGVLTFPGSAQEMKRKRVRESWEENYKGPSNAGRTAILYGGLDYKSLGIPNSDAQFLETRAFQVTEVARWFNIPPHKIRDLTRATFSNIEEQNEDYYASTLLYWITKFEQEDRRKLLTPEEQGEYFTTFDPDYLFRGNRQARFAAYAQARQWGWMSVNDVLRKEGENTIGPEGDVYLSPVNMVPADQAGNVAPDPVPPKPALPAEEEKPAAPKKDKKQKRAALASSHREIFIETARRFFHKEANAARAAAKRPGEFMAWIDGFYPRHAEQFCDAMRPIFAALHHASRRSGDETDAEIALSAAISAQAKFSAEMLTNLAGRVGAADLATSVDGLVSIWESTRASNFANRVMGKIDNEIS